MKEQKERAKFVQNLKKDNRSLNIYNPWEVSFSSAETKVILDNLKINGVYINTLDNYILNPIYN